MMLTIAGYQILTKIYESSGSVVFRSIADSTNTPAILKVLKDEYPTPDRIMRYKQEYRMTSALSTIPGVIGVHGLEHYRNTLVMIVEDFGAESLKILTETSPFAISEILRIAMHVTGIIGSIHQSQVIHKDINPANIVYNPASGIVKVIDFGISSHLPRENPVMRNPYGLEGTLAYISPEQTGRMNRFVDYRTDYYSLGATLYELCTGRPPFEATDPLEMVHCHIARLPVPPHLINPCLSEFLSAIVMKLLSKNAEDRYQSAMGIRADLEESLHLMQSATPCHSFVLGTRDIPEGFHIPQKLHGRTREVALLIDAFRGASKGEKGVVLVSGPAGIGKTSVVREIDKPITRQSGYFIAGKFDRFQRSTPYSGLVAAFKDLIRQVLAEPESKLARWRRALCEALGTGGQVIVDVIPELELIIGPQPPAQSVGPQEALNRFKILFLRLVKVFCVPDRPLVVFLDDVQWADSASLNVIKLLVSDDESHHLLLICAYRDTVVEDGHPLLLTTDELRKSRATIREITLAALMTEHLVDLASETLHREPEAVLPLAALLHRKTGGNPFFVNEFLRSLYVEHLLTFDAGARGWHWDMQEIEARDITENVVELISGNLAKLDGMTRKVLQLAACIGNRFELETLAIVCEKPSRETLAALKKAMTEGFVLPLGDAYKFVGLDVPASGDPVHVEFKFSHDRIQQAAYSLIPHDMRQVFHLKIGKLLNHNIPASRRQSYVFSMVNQLNAGMSLIEDRSERHDLARLNLTAGRKAKASGAFDPALQYFAAGIELLRAEGWEEQYELTLELHRETAQAAYLCGDYEEMERLVETALARPVSLLDRVSLYEIRIQACVAQNKMQEAVRMALPVLALLGVHFPAEPSKLTILLSLLRTKLILMGRHIESLAELPEMTDPLRLAAMGIIASVAQAAYVGAPQFVPLFICKLVRLSVKHGNAPVSPFAYATYGFILCAALGDIDGGYRFGQLALTMCERCEAPELKARTAMVVNFLIRHWKEHVRETLPAILEIHRNALDVGDLEDAALCAYFYCAASWRIGTSLVELERRMAAHSAAIRTLNQQPSFRFNETYRQVVQNLLGRSADPCRLVGESFDEETMEPIHLATNDRSGLCILYLNKMYLCYLFDRCEEALEHASRVHEVVDGIMGTPAVPVMTFFDSLVCLAFYSQADGSRKRRLLKRVAANQKKLRKWARHCPANYGHRFALVEAERERVLGRRHRALDRYNEAVELARRNEYFSEETLARELAGKFFLSTGRTDMARIYLLDARYGYLRWGAVAKVNHLDRQYQWLLSDPTAAALPLSKELKSAMRTSTSGADQELNLAAVMKASLAISGEIVFEKLLMTLMKIVLESAGAESGVLILESEGSLLIEAEVGPEADGVVLLHSRPVEKSQELSTAIVNYVARTKESLVMNDASSDPEFAGDPYIARKRPKSILCTPLLHQGRLTGIVYLENNLTSGAFTADRLEVFQLICSQAAISLQNARLYERMELLVSERTSELRKSNEDLNREAEEKERVQQAFLRAKIAAETANRAKSDFLANMSHELRTPLNAVMAFSEILEDRRFGELNERQLKYVAYIHSSGVHLLNLINDILDLAKVESGKMELHLGPVNLAHLLKGSLVLVKEKARQHNLRLSLQVDDRLANEGIQADELRLKQIMFNLLSNASKFTPDGGSITTEAKKTGPEVLISVTDTGIGLEQQDKERVFRAFEQVDSSYARKQEGTGLGLALTRKMVEFHGGRIWVESEGPGAGCTFRFTIPIPDAGNVTLRPSLSSTEKEDEPDMGSVRENVPMDDSWIDFRISRTTDRITGLWNRDALENILRREWIRCAQEALPLGFIMAGVDGMDEIRREHGHSDPDAILREVARRIFSAIRSQDHAGRYSDTEFVIVLPGCGIEETRSTAERLRSVLGESPVVVSDRNILISLSLGGAAAAGTEGLSPATLSHGAYQALERARSTGGNRTVMASDPEDA